MTLRVYISGGRKYRTTQIQLMFTNYEALVLCVVLLAIRRKTANLSLYGLCTRYREHDCNEMAVAVTCVSNYSSIIPHPTLKVADFIEYS